MILYKENSKNFTHTHTQTCYVAGYKINIQKSVAFWYTNNKLSKKEMKKTILFTITSKIYGKKKLNNGYYSPGHERNREMLVKGHTFLWYTGSGDLFVSMMTIVNNPLLYTLSLLR